MAILNHSIIGSGLSALITDLRNSDNTVFTDKEAKVIKSKRFYEYQNLGGNSNLWGGYINFKRYKKLLNNEEFKNFMLNNSIFEVKKFIHNKHLSNTYYLSEKTTNKVFRVKEKDFKSKIYFDKIKSISIKKDFISLKSNRKSYKTNSVSLCVGNLGLIELLYNSKLINKQDKISFYDGSVGYNFNLFINHRKNYFIPMPFNEIYKKIKNGKMEEYSKIEKVLILQKFSDNVKTYSYSVEEIIKFKTKYIRYFLSNHIAGLKINNTPIKQYIELVTDKIIVKCSGINKEYFAGPISQDIIFNALIK